ncbi:MAG: ABC transporter ATP-binding protein [Bacilli bacterium]|nr:ABC transporter ATP-binding protein [Bacilli bacterium]
MKEFINNLKLAWKFSKYQKKRLIFYLFLSLLEIIISLIMPILGAGIIINLTKGAVEQLVLVSMLVFLIEILRNVVSYFESDNIKVINKETSAKLQTELGKSILKLENSVIDKNGSGVFIQRLTKDSYKISGIFFSLNRNLSNIITNLGVLGAIFIMNEKAFLFMLITTFINYLLENKRSSSISREDEKYRESQERASSFISELVRGLRDIKMLNAEKSFLKKFNDINLEANESSYKIEDKQNKFSFLKGLILDLNDLLLIMLLAYLIYAKELETATALIIYNYSGRVSSIVYFIGNFLDVTKDFNLSSKRVFSIIDGNGYNKEKFGNKEITKVKGDFEFENVSFSYDKKNVLENLTFKVNANETVAFVGKSGAGKTTIFNLLCKMYDVKEGTIKIDGIDITELTRESIRRNITIINQNPYIFNLTIRENLKIVKDGLTEKEMVEACRLACLDDFIESLPDKYDTLIGEGGINLSGGQKQRLAIARALIQKTEIILFDEATSALDNETQNKIQKAIENMKSTYTIMIIAHRLSTIINSDRILFLDNGKIEAEGTHEELLKKSKEYKKLYEKELNKIIKTKKNQ